MHQKPSCGQAPRRPAGEV